VERGVTSRGKTLVILLVGLGLISALISIAALTYVPGLATYLGATNGADCVAERNRFGGGWVTLPVKTEYLDGEVAQFNGDSYAISMICVQGKLLDIQYQLTAIPTP